MDDQALSLWGFILSVAGVIISMGGTYLSWISARNAKTAANAANAAKKEVLKNQQNISLSQLRQTGLDVRRQCLQLNVIDNNNTWNLDIEKILISIEDFSNQCRDIKGQITVIPGFSVRPDQVNKEVSSYRQALKQKGNPIDPQFYVSKINENLSILISTINEQIDKNTK